LWHIIPGWTDIKQKYIYQQGKVKAIKEDVKTYIPGVSIEYLRNKYD